MTLSPTEQYLRVLALVYTRFGEPGVQENQDFDLLIQGESWDGLADLLMAMSGVLAMVLEEIETIHDALDGDDLADDDPIAQARAVLDSLRDMFVNQGVNEPS
jgi:hypothetical protein